MNSLRTKITLLTVCVVIIALVTVTLLSVLFIRNNERLESNQLLLLLCETGERNLDYYFDSVEKSVKKVASFVEEDLDGLEVEQLAAHIERVGKYFDEMAYRTNGVLTYYYRIDPAVSQSVKGFWYIDLDGEGLVPHEVTDITLYDTEDTSKLVWFTVPKHTGQAIWLPPYITDNLDKRVISYNVPIYYGRQFVGVVGIEIDYSTMAEQVENIRLYNNGYAFLCDAEGEVFFHPRIDVTQLTEETMPDVPEGLVSDSTFVSYTYSGVEKKAAWLPLCNGMRLYVSVPIMETEGEWQSLIRGILIVSAVVLLCMSAFTLFYTGRITRPLQQLTDHINEHITDLNKRVYIDALTSVKNKGAFSTAIDKLQERIDSREDMEFAVGVFDCDDLKTVNDRYGHDKGDVYLKTACRLICKIFQHSPVFRIGGDEFAVILQNDDYNNREALLERFDAAKADICAATENRWEQVHIARGIAVYDPKADTYAIDTVRRADSIMYTNKRIKKEKRAEKA